MASDKAYLDFILDQLSAAGDVSYRAMMGKYILCYRGKIIGGIYDNRFLVKPTASAKRLMPEAEEQQPYPGAKNMLLVDDPDDREHLCALLEAMYPELPDPKPRRKQKGNADKWS